MKTDTTPTAPVDKKWKTYVNDSLGFSFEIPSGAGVGVNRDGNYFTIKDPVSKDQISLSVGYEDVDINKDYPSSDIYIKVRNPISIDNSMNGWQIIQENDYNSSFSLDTVFVSPKDNKRFTLSVIKARDDSIVYEKFISQQETYNHILSTFSCCSVRKQTYTNNDYGYSLIIPSDWKTDNGGSNGGDIRIYSLGGSNTITLVRDSNGPYMFDDRSSIYPVEKSNIKPQKKEIIVLAGQEVNLFTFVGSQGNSVQITEILLPENHRLTIFISAFHGKKAALDKMQSIINTLLILPHQE